MSLDYIDPIGGVLAFVRDDIRRGKSETAAELSSLDDLSRYGERPAEIPVGRFHIASGKRLPNERATDSAAVDAHGGDLTREKSRLHSKNTQEIGIALAVSAKAPSLTDTDSSKLVGGLRETRDELLGFNHGKITIKRNHQRVGNTGRCNESKLGVWWGQKVNRNLGAQH